MSVKTKFIAIMLLMLLVSFTSAATINMRVTHANSKTKGLIISGHFECGVAHGDSVIVTLTSLQSVFSAYLGNNYAVHRTYSAPVSECNFKITINSVSTLCYLSVSDFKNKLGTLNYFLDTYLAQVGDNINLTVRAFSEKRPNMVMTESGSKICNNCRAVSFSGAGSAKYNCRFQMDLAASQALESVNAMQAKQAYTEIEVSNKKGVLVPSPTVVQQSDRYRQVVDAMLKSSFKKLREFKGKLSGQVYQLLRANMIGKMFKKYSRPMNITVDDMPSDSLEDYRILYLSRYYNNAFGIPDSIAVNAPFYLDFILEKSDLEAKLFCINLAGAPEEKRFERTYYLIRAKYKGELRQKLLFSYYVSAGFRNNSNDIVKDLVNTISKSEYLDMLGRNMIGKAAYDFSLPDSADQKISLHRFKGKVVFIDFWFTGCSGCAEYYRKVVSKAEEHFRENPDVVFVSISLDANKAYWVKSVHSNVYTSSAVVNLYKANSSPVVKQFFLVACPYPLIIDKNGRIFSNSELELRLRGDTGLENKISEALATK